MKYAVLLLFLIGSFLSGCSTNDGENQVLLAKNQFYFYGTNHIRPDNSQDEGQSNLIFMDSTSLGKQSGQFKVELSYVKNNQNEEQELLVILYKKESQDWDTIQTLVRSVDVLAFSMPIFEDFNADGYADLSTMTGTAARGANEVRTLFLFNPDSDQLLPVHNSEHYPNLKYNEQTNGITALLYSGSVSTVFLEIRGDSLVPIAEVSFGDQRRVVRIVNAHGEYETISDLSVNDPDFIRYSNYSPVEIDRSE